MRVWFVLHREGSFVHATYDESAPQIATLEGAPIGQDLTTLTSWEVKVAASLCERERDLCDHAGDYCRRLD